jgi:hypothetical protein
MTEPAFSRVSGEDATIVAKSVGTARWYVAGEFSGLGLTSFCHITRRTILEGLVGERLCAGFRFPVLLLPKMKPTAS